MALTRNDVVERLNQQRFDDLTQLKLNIDAYRLHLRHKFDPVSVAAIGKIDPLPHQVEAFIKMMAMLRPQSGIDGRIRMLLADDVGLGKTIIIGLVMKELILRKKINRVLIVCPSGLQIQWKEELREKFNENFEIIRGKIDGNPYQEINRAIISVDVGRSDEKTHLLMQTQWDMVVFDESHRLKPGNLRYELASELSKRTKHLVLATATPHDGKIQNFIGLIRLIDNDMEYNNNAAELRRYLEPKMLRRLKEDIVDFRGKKIFPERDEPQTINIDYSHEEKDFYDAVEDYVQTYYQKAEEANKSTAILALYILHRRVSSSIQAGVESLRNRRQRILEPYLDSEAEEEDYLSYLNENCEREREDSERKLIGVTASITSEDVRAELAALDPLIEMGEELVERGLDSKYQKLLELLKDIRTQRPEDKIIIFTEFSDTLSFLERALTEENFILAKIQGGMDIDEKKDQARYFERTAGVLLGTEAAGEGLNLQFANIAINYELPWNPNRLEQRIGRVYRYGQKKKVFIHNFMTAFPIDRAVLDRILLKMDNIRAIFGDSAIDVIGSLISEKDMLDIFKITRGKGSGIDEVDRLFTEKVEVLKEIEHFLIKGKFNLLNLRWITKDFSRCINNFDIQRFLLAYAESNKSADCMPNGDQYHLSIPGMAVTQDSDCSTLENIAYNDFNGTVVFDPQKKGIYIALGHPALECALSDSIFKNSVSFIDAGEKGVLLSYVVRFYNGLGKEIYAEPVLVLKKVSDVQILDPLAIWDLKDCAQDAIDRLRQEDYLDQIEYVLNNAEPIIKANILSLENFVQDKNEKDIETENQFILAEYDWRIKNQQKKKQTYLEVGQSYLIPAIEKRVSELKSEFRLLKSAGIEARKISWQICGPIDIAILIPAEAYHFTGQDQIDFQELQARKRAVELKGMEFVMDYERDHGRFPEDVSERTYLGYDIKSTFKDETRYIEVKSFASKNLIEISSNEWRTASQYRDDYYLYVVQNTSSEPKLDICRDPYLNLAGYIERVPIKDFKMVLEEIPKERLFIEKR
jgi:ERCC4-related helicase